MSVKKDSNSYENRLKRFLYKYYYVLIMMVFAVIIINLFYKIGTEPINDWDEARHGINAYEMIKNNNYIVNTFNYENDYYNLKPPLSYWAIIIGFKTIGYNLVGLRFFSVLSALCTIFLVAVFTYKRFGRIASLISSGVMATSVQFFRAHCARSADADSLYVLLFTIAVIGCIYAYHKLEFIYISGLTFSLAFLDKSWHSIAIVGVVGCYLLATKLIIKINLKQWIIFFLCSFTPIFLWGTFRVRYDGYRFIKEMINYDLLSRTSTALEGHIGPWNYYLELLYSNYIIYIITIFILILILIASRGFVLCLKSNFSEYIGIILWIIVPLLMFSIAKTKLSWYIVSIYPPLAILLGALAEESISTFKRSIIPIILIVAIITCGGIYEYKLLSILRNSSRDVLEEYIRDAKISIKDYQVYIYTPLQYGGPDWNQRNILALEMYKDGRAENGGVKAFLKSKKNSVIFLNNNDEAEKIIKENKLKILDSDKNIITAYR
ncbi:glycosyltransferase family 39 protein [Clostridium sp. C8-1-8]|uniref:ArnT family glycosyltransferase n=1 Tax=Clostridium sp. C8-1-8 TaxID=2698831 RepID=UPI001367A836|nr:glycosyltransferase family 39 protein [Clostridium sp. C8-1-8]